MPACLADKEAVEDVNGKERAVLRVVDHGGVDVLLQCGTIVTSQLRKASSTNKAGAGNGLDWRHGHIDRQQFTHVFQG